MILLHRWSSRITKSSIEVPCEPSFVRLICRWTPLSLYYEPSDRLKVPVLTI